VPHGSLIVGPYEVIPLCDGWAPLPLGEELPGVEVDWDAERSRFRWAFREDDSASWAWHIHSFLVRHRAGLVLVDTGIGSFGRPPYDVAGRIDEELRAAGASREDVTDVVLTHLHADHSGGACFPDGSPRFPNARHHVHPDDWRFFGEERTPEDFTGRFALEAVERAGLLDLDPADHEVGLGLRVEHAPGHTPGHRVVRVEGGESETLLLTGDLLHVPQQIDRPSAWSNHDEEPELGAASRIRLLAIAQTEGWSVGVSHFARPFGQVGADGWSSV
jgi:glyoxylase-like metal-dependent hydrolase (beta-lactamase superfamily II)